MSALSRTADFLAERARRLGGLRSSMIIAVLAAIILPAVLIGYIMVDRSYREALSIEHTQRAEKFADLLQASMTRPMWDFSPESGRQVLAAAGLDPSVMRIRVIDEHGATFLDYEQPNARGKTSPDPNVLHIQRTIKTGTTTIGSVELIYSLAPVVPQARKLSDQLAAVILMQVATSIIVLLFFIDRHVLRPITQLEHVAAVLTESNLDVEIPELGKDEIGRLAHQLELMRDSVKRSFAQLETEIIERTKANEAIQTLNASLEERVHERTSELLEANITLARTLEDLRSTQRTLVQSEKLASLGSLVAGVAHELNTPIGNGLAAASTMEDETRRFISRLDQGIKRSELEHFLSVAEEGSRLVRTSLQRAAELVGSFKQVAVDQIGAQRRPFQLAELVQETALTLSPGLKRTRVHFTQQVPADIYLDSFPGALIQVISNLFTNSLAHAFEDGAPGEMRLVAARAGVEHVRIEFSDNGTGIPPAHLGRIYDPFFTTKLGKGGSGLGLHIVHNIVTSILGGEIQVQSEEGKGTTFIITIPLAAP